LKFKINFLGEYLSGEPFIVIPANSTVIYQLYFLPLTSFELRHGVISFISEKIGEIWYQLDLVSKPKKPEKLKLMKAELVY
jgi:hypothetical protein